MSPAKMQRKDHANARAAEKDEEHEEGGGSNGEDSPSMFMVRDHGVRSGK